MSAHDLSNLRTTIVPKSDQLNAEQLLGGDMTVSITEVSIGSTDEQPISIHYKGEEGRPYKPCKTMRKLLIFAWGEDGRQWIGKSMTLYNDESVKFGGVLVGGIRISHLSGIERDINVSLTSTKGKKALHTIKVLRPMVASTTKESFDVAKILKAFDTLGVSSVKVAEHLGHDPSESDRAELERWYRQLRAEAKPATDTSGSKG